MTRDHRKDSEEERPHGEPVIEDLRHSRDLEAVPDEPLKVIEPPAAPAPAAAQPEPQPAPQPAPPAQPSQPPVVVEEVPAEEVAEMDQLRQLFGSGIIHYLRSQLGMLINFAVIYLGRAPNPATGLLGNDLPKAKLTIDLLEVVTSLIQAEMPAAERTELSNILAELKYTFLQAAAGSTKVPEPPGEA